MKSVTPQEAAEDKVVGMCTGINGPYAWTRNGDIYEYVIDHKNHDHRTQGARVWVKRAGPLDTL